MFDLGSFEQNQRLADEWWRRGEGEETNKNDYPIETLKFTSRQAGDDSKPASAARPAKGSGASEKGGNGSVQSADEGIPPVAAMEH